MQPMQQTFSITPFQVTKLTDFSDEIRPASQSEIQAIAPIVSSLAQWAIDAQLNTDPFISIDSMILPQQTYDDGTPFVVTETVYSKTKRRGVEWRILTSAQIKQWNKSPSRVENKENMQLESAACLFPHAISSDDHFRCFDKHGAMSIITDLPLVSFFSKDGNHGIDFLQVELVKKGILSINFGSIVYVDQGIGRYRNSLCLEVDINNRTFKVYHQNPNVKLADIRSLRTAYIAISKAMSDEFQPEETYWRFAALDFEPC